MRIRNDKGFDSGYNPIVSRNTIREISGNIDYSNVNMDFGILKLLAGHSYEDSNATERAFLLINGTAQLKWDNNIKLISRSSFLDENPFCLHVPANVNVKIESLSDDTELSISSTDNTTNFDAKLYSQNDVRSEYRGAGTMRDTSTRIVRTIIDYSNAPYSNLVIGEVIDFPGKWSSYPPHYHPQPEIYFYKHYPENGYGYCELGEEVVKVKNNDTVLILDNATHPQTTAPGYAMYYIWVIRHIDGNPYIEPVFVPEHLWVTKPDANIWPHEKHQ